MKNKYLAFLLLTFAFLQSHAQNAPQAVVTIDTPGAICTVNDCTQLNAQYFDTKATSNYNVSSITYQNLFPYTGGTVLNADQDDTWSAIYNLPFPVCFYGNKYDKVLIGSNGLITFNIIGVVPGGTETPGPGGSSYCAWNTQFSPDIPNNAFPIKNSIYGVYQDTNINAPPVSNPLIQNVNYYVGGSFPNRYFVANFNELPLFGNCTAQGNQTSQIVIYETTNIIDVYVKRRQSCSAWNGAKGIIGIQNQSGSLGMAAPGRNTSSPAWNTTNEAWRFTPNGTVQSTFHWEYGGANIGNQNPLPVCGTDLGLYTAVVDYKLCDNNVYATQTDTWDLQLEGPLPVQQPLDIKIPTCTEFPTTVDIDQDAYILSTAPDPSCLSLNYYEDPVEAENGSGNFLTPAQIAAYPINAISDLPKVIYVRVDETCVTGCFNVLPFLIKEDPTSSGTFTYPNPSYCQSQPGTVSIVQGTVPVPNTAVYTAVPAGLSIVASNGTVTPSTSSIGIYTVTATVAATTTCPEYTTTANIEIKNCNCTATASNSTTATPICKDGTFSLSSTNSVAGSTFAWTGPGGYTSTAQNPTGISVPAGAGPFIYTVTTTTPTGDTCSASTTLTITPDPIIALTSAAGSNVQTVCVNVPMATPIQYAITNATGATASPLPAGITATFAAGVLTISGTPTTAAATLNYTVTTTGGCAAFPATATGSITVANQTIVLTSAPATQNQTVCINTNIINTVYTVGAQANGATVTGLPAGVTGVFAGSTFTISGSPSAVGPFSYTITTSSSTVSCAGATINGTITVNPLPTVTVTTTTPCAGVQATVTAVPGDAQSYTYVWTVPSGAANPGNVSTFNTSTAGVYTVVITNTITNCVSASASGTVTINPLPTVTVASSPISICGGQSATLTATPGTPGTYSYAWTTPAGATNPGNVPSFSTTTTGSYSVTITNTITTCVSAPASVTINASPAPIVVTSSTSPCVGTSATVTAVASPSGTYTYVWTVPSGVTDPGNVASFTTTVAGAYSVVATNTTTTCPSVSVTQNVTFKPIPTLTVADASACQGSSATLTAVPGDANAYNIVWTVPTGATNPGNVLTFTTTTAGSYSAVITDAVSGCASTSATANVVINPLPTGTITGPTFCEGSTTTVTVTPAVAGTYSYAWTVPTGVTNPGSVATFTTSVAGNYSVVITNTVTNCVSAPLSIGIIASPVPTVLTSSTSPCVGTSATVTAVASPAGTYTYVWTVPTGVTDPGNVASFTTTVAGAYSVVATNTTTTCPSVSVTQNVTFKPIPTLTIADASACQGLSATLTAVPGDANAYNIVWTVPTGATNPGNVLTFTTTTAGSYSAVITDAVSGCASTSATANVVINPLPTGTITGPTFCEGSTTTVTVTPAVAGTYSYAWTVPTGVINPGSVATFTTSVAGNYSVVITNTVTNCVSIPISIIVNQNLKPIVALAGSSVCQGQNATLTALPSSAGTYSYSWIVPTGATNPGNVASFQTMVGGDYSVVITNTTTTCASDSATARVIVNALPTVTITAPSVCAGNIATVTALPGSGGTYSYAWTVPAGVPAPGNVNSFTTTVAGNYTVIITDTATTCSSLQASGTLIINALPTVTVAGQTVCGGTATVTATPGVAGTYNYVWTVPSGATNPGSVASFSTSVSGTYSVIITNTTTTCSSASASGTATINPIPTVTVSAPPICSGAASTVVATPGSGSAAQYSYVWTVPTGATNPGNVASFNTTVAGNYSVVITSIATGCTSASASTTVVVNPVPVAVVTTANMTLCSGGTTSINITSGTPGTTFAWTVTSQTGVSGASAGTGNNIAQTLTTTGNANGSVTYSVVPTANGCTGTAQSITIAVIRLPSVTLPAGPINLCSGQTTNIQVVGSITGTTFIVDVVSPNVSGATGAINAAGFITDVLVATGTNGGQVVYSVTPVNGGCPGPSKSVTVNVSPIPTAVANGPLTVCSGERTNIIINDPVTASTTFSWTAAATIGVSGASAGSGTLIAQTLTTIGTTPGTVTYTITPTSNSCVGATTEIIVTVNPRPTAPGNSNPAPICSGNNIVVPILAGISGTTYSWTIGTVNGVSGASAGSGTTIDQTLVTTDNAVGTVQYIIEPKLGDCTGPTATITVTVYPSPAVDIADGIICVDENGNNTTTYTFNTGLNTAQYSFSWYLDGTDLNSSDSSYMASIPGVYTVRVKNNTTNCINEDSATLTTSTGPQIVTVSPVRYFNDDQVVSINVVPAGDYEYQIDNGIFQSSNQFANLGGGSHTVVVRNICDQKPVTFTVITYPKFFTPNGDGYNDFWNIYDLKDQAQSRIYIFDRYGKLIKEMSPQGQGWDGKFNQQLMPGTDYWFKVMYDENGAEREFKAHFSLKR